MKCVYKIDMPKSARLVYPNLPHHVIQRGNRNQNVFFQEDDYRLYLSLLKEQCHKAETKILAYCLMTNHVHLIVEPRDADGLRIIGEAHRRYTRYINAKMKWKGYLWQGRFSSFPMDERYCYEALRYVELNPVRACICQRPQDYRWSSARQRVSKSGVNDLKVANQNIIEDWKTYWKEGLQKQALQEIFEKNEIQQNFLGIRTSGAQ